MTVLDHKPLLFDVMHAHRHGRPISGHWHGNGVMGLRQGLSMGAARSDAIVFGLCALWSTNAASWIVEGGATEASIGVIVIPECIWARKRAMVG